MDANFQQTSRVLDDLNSETEIVNDAIEIYRNQ